MYTIPAKSTMPRRKRTGPTVQFQLRLAGDEAERWQQVREWAVSRNARCNDTQINRRLLGLDPDTDGLVTEKDRRYFLGAKASGKSAEIFGRAATGKSHIKEVSPKIRRK